MIRQYVDKRISDYLNHQIEHKRPQRPVIIVLAAYFALQAFSGQYSENKKEPIMEQTASITQPNTLDTLTTTKTITDSIASLYHSKAFK
jgi:hypothetical protein